VREKKIFPVHPAFRVVAIGSKPVKKNMYLSNEEQTLFHFHLLSPLAKEEEEEILQFAVPNCPPPLLQKLLHFEGKVKSNSEYKNFELSLRQKIRALKKATYYHEEGDHGGNLNAIIHQIFLSHFLPPVARKKLNKLLKQSHIHPQNLHTPTNKEEKQKPREKHSESHLVPQVEFYEIPTHTRILKQMKADFDLGEHLLLIGVQGVGKNKLADKFLEKYHIPRQYIQLHRDTTVASLTLQPGVVDGQLVFEDSPLVKAVKHGHVLVIDEADKAEVCISILSQNSNFLLFSG